MGAETFYNKVKAEGRSTEQAFKDEREQAAWDYGHSGYTGTIAEKPDFKLRQLATFPTLEAAEAFVNKDIDENEKWGDAFVVKYLDEAGELWFYFYGWASS